ncbi:HEPN domain-containing protein [Arachidicoccus rhizosphaerae]|uniref:HEPN domain-containing protein n=1 Tax=Arachidicoccus rhizosphaerae TaxID=551991 RepID=A0A1H3VSK0_9BACT|nr:HEPN domain-containing protein [Arachidicoccus rhizosphaerae]SDZ77757.1 HEPN domain-containing protein [Arachidicoccus rhizosphaerae]
MDINSGQHQNNQTLNHPMQGIAPHKTNVISPLVQFIVAALAPSKIYKIKRPEQSHMDPDPYIDLMVVLPSKSNPSFFELQSGLELSYIKDNKVACSIQNEEELLKRLQEGQIFYALHCTPENLVYDDQALDYPVPAPELIKTTKEDAMIDFEKNYAKALAFRSAATSLLENDTTTVAIFLLHQAAELSLRALLLSLSGQETKTHEIRRIQKQVHRYAPPLSDIFPEETLEERFLLEEFDLAYTHARYCDAYKIAAADLDIIIHKVNLLLERTRQTADSYLKI